MRDCLDPNVDWMRMVCDSLRCCHLNEVAKCNTGVLVGVFFDSPSGEVAGTVEGVLRGIVKLD